MREHFHRTSLPHPSGQAGQESKERVEFRRLRSPGFYYGRLSAARSNDNPDADIGRGFIKEYYPLRELLAAASHQVLGGRCRAGRVSTNQHV
ncbi:MAG: hypothetical protein EOO61_02590 [Hymenobacter sp.]|nr:MAG: hypothetical protein EOO61_02590 [Hymenobacter sp.]